MAVNQTANSQRHNCPNGCCNGDELLCISIPEPITIVLLGNTLTLELPCLRLTSEEALTGEDAAEVLGVLTRILGAIGAIVDNDPNTIRS